MATYTLKIIRIKQETPNVVTLSFKQPALKKIKYLAGQYLTLIFRINGRRYIRPYSFSSAPGIDELLEITVKRVPNGIVSNHIVDMVKVNDSIEVMEPMGDFIFQNKETLTDVYFWGVGSGITPLFSLIKYILSSNTYLKVHLMYGSKNYEHTIFKNQIEHLLSIYSDRFSLQHFHTEVYVGDKYPDVIEGRIDQVKALKMLTENPVVGNSSHYICGPFGLKESVKQALDSSGVIKSLIFSEDFELIKNPADFVDIQSQTVRLNFQNQEYNLEVVKGKSILEAALDTNIELPYSCQTGNCSTCRGKIVEGKTRMIGLVKERTDLQETETLLCCTYPLTENIIITI